MVQKVNAQNRIDHERAVQVLKTQGLTFSEPTSTETARWKGLADEASREMVGQGLMSAELVDTLNDMLSEYRDSLD